ncbi:hypothetical protein BVY02_02110, partial [bacterium J17]
KQNLCAVGDDDQSIYAFRGASVQNILNFKQDFPEAEVVTLKQNYRSTKKIIEAANNIIINNVTRAKKSMVTDNPEGEEISLNQAYDEKEEAEFVSQEICHLLQNGHKASEIAVFYRTNAQSRAVEEIFCEYGLPYEIYGGHKFYDRKEIKDILSYLKLLINSQDNEAFLRVINTPTRGIGKTSLEGLAKYASATGLALLPALAKATSVKASWVSKANHSKFAKFLNMISQLRESARTANMLLSGQSLGASLGERKGAIAHLLKEVAEKSEYLSRLQAEETTEAQSRLENIEELYRVAYEFTERALTQEDKLSLNDFLDRASLSSQSDMGEKSDRQASSKIEGSISLMTLHLAKGLEFDSVFLVGMEEGLLPHSRSIYQKEALEEERRLCYVGVTRAKRKLFLSYASSRRSYGSQSPQYGEPSRFLDEIGFRNLF